jgi:apolipoprotein D and lipocalin family protein
VDVYNSCNEPSTGELREIRGFATNNDANTNAQFTVDFGLPHKGQYWIIGLDSDYRYAVVSDPSKLSLYILSKTPTLEPELYDEAVQIAAEQLDVSRLVMTPQMGCTYP